MAKPSVFEGLNLLHDLKSLDEACKAFGFDFPVESGPLEYTFKGEKRVTPQNVQIFAGDNGEALGVTGLLYTIVSYREAFAPVDELIHHGARILGGAAPNKRERAYLLLEMPGTIKLSEGDEISNRFLMTSGHDGSSKVEIRLVPYRERNRTALTITANHPLAFKHTPNIAGRINRARRIYQNVNKEWEAFSVGVQRMVQTNVTDLEARGFIDNVLGESDSTRMKTIKNDIYATFKTGTACQLPRVKGTVFGLVQAFAEWADHDRTTRKSKKRDEVSAGLDTRLVSDSAKKKARAWSVALWFMKTNKVDSDAI